MKHSLLLLISSLALGGSAQAQTLPDDIDITTSPNGVVQLPSSVSSVFTNVFDRYTKITAPNGQAIHFLMQSNVTDEMAVRAREVMRFFLTDVPGSQYGADKTAIMNRMGNWEAALCYFNTGNAADQAFNGPFGNANVFAQDLYANESVVEGSNFYFNNNRRDATFEEVFHLVHGAGIQPILPAFHTEITNATNAAIAANIYNPPPTWELPPQDRPFEYIISVIDVYYGYWAHNPSNDGMAFWGEYAFHTKADIINGDPAGVAAMLKFLPEFMNADLSCAASMNTTFHLDRVSSLEYTYKSQYMDNVRLRGTNTSHLVGNDRDNVLEGNAADNNIDGGAGTDTAAFKGALAEYVVQGGVVTDTQSGRDGSDTLTDIEYLQFSDQTVPVGGAGSAVNYCASSPNSSGAAAVIYKDGSLFVSANDLSLYAMPIPANQPGIFFFGPNQAQAPFGNGTRCVGAPITRFQPRFANLFGELEYDIDNQAAPVSGAFTPGSVWNFQAWFRDPTAGGSNFDLSDGLQVTFAP